MSATIRLTSVYSGLAMEVTAPWTDDEAREWAAGIRVAPAPRLAPDDALAAIERDGALPVYALTAEVVP